MYVDSINNQNQDYALSALGNVIICTNAVSDAKTITLPIGYDYDSNLSIKVLFVNGHNCANSSTPMTLNGKSIVVNKYGSLIPLPINSIDEGGTTVYKAVQANTVLEMYYNSNYDGNNNGAFVVIGNPAVISNADYTIYADGSITYSGLITSSSGIMQAIATRVGNSVSLIGKFINSGNVPSSTKFGEIAKYCRPSTTVTSTAYADSYTNVTLHVYNDGTFDYVSSAVRNTLEFAVSYTV